MFLLPLPEREVSMQSRRQRQQLLFQVVVSLVLPIGVLIVTTQLFPLLAEASFMAALAVVVTSAWFTGWTGGIIACAISFIALDYLTLTPLQSLMIHDPQQVVKGVSFLLLSLLMIAVTTNRHRAYQKLEAANAALKQAENELLRLQDRLARELMEVTRLHELSGQLLMAQDLHAMLEQILKASIELFGGKMGTIQLYDEREHVLRMVACIGFTDEFYEQFKTVPMGYSCCGAAMKQRQRIIIENVFNDAQFQQFALIYAKHGFVACLSTPLYSSDGKLFGMLSNHFDHPHRPSERELQLLDMYAQHAERVIERKRTQEALEHANADLQRDVQARTTDLLIKHQQLRSLAQQLAQTEEGERKNLARDLHDNLAQNLTLAKMRLAILQNHDEAPMTPIVEELKDLVDHAVTYVRTLMGDLRPTLLGDEDDVLTAMQWVIEKMSRYGLHVDVDDDGKTKRLDEEALVLAYHSVHEFLFNVLKHARTRNARVVLRNVAGHLEITVIDEGQGFDMATKPVPTAKGGFGLFSIRERIALLGGRCEIVSDRGKGTRATIVIPLSLEAVHAGRQPHTASRQTLSDNQAPSVMQHLRVLLVHDHAVMRQGLRSLLQDDVSLEVVGEASNGEMAVELVSLLQPHVVVMDCEMPTMNGFEATRRIKCDFPKTVVIGLSCSNDPDTAAAMRACGASAYVSKEQAVSHLLKTIHSVSEPEEMASTGSNMSQ